VRPEAALDAALVAQYERRLPRYTSYPTAPHFHAGIDAATYRRWLGAIAPGAAASLYLHVPFCEAMCWYCGCHTTVAKSHGPVARYVELLEREMALVAAAIPFRLGVAHIHWGGGTPNLLAADELARLFAALRRHFDLAPDAEIAVELDPRTLDRDRVRALARGGVNRASLGVQDLDPRVQAAINRHQPYEQTAEAVALLRDHGIARLNVDLMYGLPYQTEEGLLRSIDAMAALAPDRFALFGYAHVPWMKPHQRRIPEAALPDTASRASAYARASEHLAQHGYRPIGIDHFACAGDALALAAAEGRLRRNFQGYTADRAPVLIGLGASAIGSLDQGYVQNEASIAGWRDAIGAGNLATRRGIALDVEDRLRRAIIERLMCDLRADITELATENGRNPADFVEESTEIDRLCAAGLGWREGWRIGVAERHRPLVRALAAVFDRHLKSGVARHSRAL
jgi:oxygen-independent coproporphyrinogen-3 oxidase